MDKYRRSKKSKVTMSLYQAPKSSSSLQYGNKAMAPNQSAAGSMGASTGFYSDSFMHMDHSAKQKKHSNHTGADSYGRVELYYDEGIDDKAASYISGVRKRFSLERGD